MGRPLRASRAYLRLAREERRISYPFHMAHTPFTAGLMWARPCCTHTAGAARRAAGRSAAPVARAQPGLAARAGVDSRGRGSPPPAVGRALGGSHRVRATRKCLLSAHQEGRISYPLTWHVRLSWWVECRYALVSRTRWAVSRPTGRASAKTKERLDFRFVGKTVLHSGGPRPTLAPP